MIENLHTKVKQSSTGNGKRNSRNSINIELGKSRTPVKSNGKKKVSVKAAKVMRKEMEENLPVEALRTCKNLYTICAKIDKLEKEKREILQKILNDSPKRKR